MTALIHLFPPGQWDHLLWCDPLSLFRLIFPMLPYYFFMVFFEFYIQDRYGLPSFNTFPPRDDEENLALISGRECDGETVIVFVRQLAACQNGQDRPITVSFLFKISFTFCWVERSAISIKINLSKTHALQSKTSTFKTFLDAACSVV